MKSPWTILLLGVVALGCLMLGMCMTLSQYASTPEGTHARIANEVAGRFEFKSVGADYDEAAGVRSFTITYITERDSQFDSLTQESEMREVALFAFKKLDDKTRKKVDEIRVNRSEIHGSGCWEDVYRTSFAMPNPDREPKPEEELENPR